MDAENDKNVPQNKEKVPNIEREGWEVKDIVEEGVNEDSGDVVRRVLRDGEAKEEGDAKDVVGSVDSEATPQGREENKKNKGDK